MINEKYTIGKIICGYHVVFKFDEDAGVWVVSSSDVPGLIMEDVSLFNLLERVEKTIPELIELNSGHQKEENK